MPDTETTTVEDAQAPLSWREKLRSCIVSAYPAALRTGLWLLLVTVPVSFAVLLMKQFGLLDLVARLCKPLFVLFGLPGEAAIVFITSCLLNIYSSIAVMTTLGFAGRTVTILALMCLISHNLPVECAVQKKTGSPAGRIMLIRIASSFAGAWALSLLLPADAAVAPLAAETGNLTAPAGFTHELGIWLVDISILCVKIMVLITLLMILQRILEAFGIIRFLARGLKYPLLFLGLSHNTAFLWIVANSIGLAYGAGVIIDNVKRGQISRPHTDSLNYHIAVSHSLLEDTLLFVAIGVSVWWITLPRIILAGAVVWLNRLYDSFRYRRLTPHKETV